MLFHFLRKIIYLSFALNILLFTFGCSQNKNVGIVGHSYTLQANIHDNDNSLDYSWFIDSQPDESNLSKKYLFYNNDKSEMTFTPDFEGNYTFQVTVSQYNDEISVESFPFIISTSSDKIIQEMNSETSNKFSDNQNDEWLSEGIEIEEMLRLIEPQTIAYNSVQKQISSQEEKKTEPKILTKNKSDNTNREPSFKKKSSAPKFTVQVGSKSTFDEAKIFALEFNQMGYDAYIEKTFIKNKNQYWYRVRVGSYDNYDSAMSLASTISTTKNYPTWVDYVRNK